MTPGKNLIQNRIKQLNEGQVMAFYNRKTVEWILYNDSIEVVSVDQT